MRPQMTNLTQVLGRIREIESKVNPSGTSPAPEGPRFVEVLEQAQEPETPSLAAGDQDGGFREEASIPQAPLSERMARWDPLLQDLCRRYDLDPNLARAVMRCESGGQEGAVSRAGALGLMQLMPGTARALGVDPRDPARNLEGGIKYLAQMADRYDGDLEKALAAYNAGAGRVDAHGGIPPIPETQRYVKNVMALYRRYSGDN